MDSASEVLSRYGRLMEEKCVSIFRGRPRDVALETTLLCRGVPAAEAWALAQRLKEIIGENGSRPAFVGVVRGQSVVGMSDAELEQMLAEPVVPKVNLSNIGVTLHRGQWGATTVGTTISLATAAGLRVMATGGIGGVHRDYGQCWDISADLAAIARTPMAVVTSGCKSILDVAATREALETLGIPVIGYRTDVFPAFYLRESPVSVDARFDDPKDLAAYLAFEIGRTGRGVIVANPVPEADALTPADWEHWWTAAQARVSADSPDGRDRTPALLAALHQLSGGATLAANLALVLDNARLAARLSRAWPDDGAR
jgi:pseudouridine-5'-phosphate glycosidase